MGNEQIDYMFHFTTATGKNNDHHPNYETIKQFI